MLCIWIIALYTIPQKHTYLRPFISFLFLIREINSSHRNIYPFDVLHSDLEWNKQSRESQKDSW